MNKRPSKNLLKNIRKLHRKKYRDEAGLFTVEKCKNISAYLESGFHPRYIFALRGVSVPSADAEIFTVDKETLRQISTLRNPYDALAVFEMPPPAEFAEKGLIVVLDNIQDPGNLGTIIRTADWFGIDQILCSKDSVDVYNPKVIQAAAGAHARVKVFYDRLETRLARAGLPVYATGTDGQNIFKTALPHDLYVMFGNEGHGLRAEIRRFAEQVLQIPHAPGKISESLNLSVSAGIVMAEWFRTSG